MLTRVFLVNMDGPNPTESKIARDEGFIIRTRMNTVNGHSDQRDQAEGFPDHLIPLLTTGPL